MYNTFKQLVGEENVLVSEPMSKHTTFKIGGAADYFITPSTEEELRGSYLAAKEAGLPIFILGNGSNLLVGDKGIRGVVICPFKKLNRIEIQGEELYAGCGAMLSGVSNAALQAELGGFEFASGIPGTVGGGVYMNAGAYGFELKNIIKSVRFMNQAGEIFEIDGEKCEFGYRESIFSKRGYMVLGCTFNLTKGNKDEIKEKINDFTNRRVTKQPIEKPSAGSVFKRPEGYFAGALVEGANLKGYSIGGAEVSEKHAGFIINTGSATARDVLSLIEHIQAVVYEKDGVKLEPEIKIIGEF